MCVSSSNLVKSCDRSRTGIPPLKKALLAVPDAVLFCKKIPDRTLFLLVLSMAPKSSEMKELGSELDFVFYEKCFG